MDKMQWLMKAHELEHNVVSEYLMHSNVKNGGYGH